MQVTFDELKNDTQSKFTNMHISLEFVAIKCYIQMWTKKTRIQIHQFKRLEQIQRIAHSLSSSFIYFTIFVDFWRFHLSYEMFAMYFAIDVGYLGHVANNPTLPMESTVTQQQRTIWNVSTWNLHKTTFECGFIHATGIRLILNWTFRILFKSTLIRVFFLICCLCVDIFFMWLFRWEHFDEKVVPKCQIQCVGFWRYVCV